MLDIKDFITLVRKEGFQRPNRFQVSISIPDKVKEKLDGLIQELNKSPSSSSNNNSGKAPASIADLEKVISLMATDVSSPGYNVSTTDMTVGSSRKIAMDKSTGDMNITFRCGGNMTEKKIFDAWCKLMFKRNHTVAFYDDYVAPSIKIYMLDLEGNIAYEATVSEAYPATVTEIALSRDQNDTVSTFQVTFNYRKLYNSDEDYGEKRRSYPPAYGANVRIPPPEMVLGAGDLPIAPQGGNEFPPISLPPAPPTNNQALFLIDIYKNVERVKRRIEDGSLNTKMGAKLIANIMRDVNGIWFGDSRIDKFTEYATDLIYILERR